MSVAVAATIAIGATGCAFMTPQDTTMIKQITDGVNVTTGKIDVRNALLISDTGKSARFVGTVVNSSNDDITLTVEVSSVAQTIVVPANSHVDPSSSSSQRAESSVESGDSEQGTRAAESDDVVFTGVKTRPGSLVKVYFSYPGAEGVSASVPVLTNAQEEYQTLAPTPSPTSRVTLPAESPTATPGADGTATPSDDTTATPAG
ncbi:hypothetical protein [Curtobacterium sp. 9128]|uniref:hypothetical protein n=1 Tax=Curtobacterium sp. 9128 TaxID=1793722 RepID=UPI0011A8DD9E|nr:hypothetical protein [Curtobacterium sp. 9128]